VCKVIKDNDVRHSRIVALVPRLARTN
jgi:hypothetical protein